MRRGLILAVAVAVASCSTSSGGGSSGGSTSSKGRDAGVRPDAGHADAGDAGAPDGGDAGLGDAGPGDAGLTDAGLGDAGEDDGGESDGGECPDGSIPFPGRILDVCQSQAIGVSVPLAGVEISTLVPYSSTVSDPNGEYTACIPSGVPTTLQYNLAGYLPGYLAELNITGASLFSSGGHSLLVPVFCDAVQQSYFNDVPQFDPSLASIFIQETSATGDPPCGGHADTGSWQANWSFSATLTDGGIGDGGPWPTGYFDSTETLQAVYSTYVTGDALIFDIDPAARYVELQATNDGGIGAECPSINTGLGLTGRVYVAGGAFSYEPWVVP